MNDEELTARLRRALHERADALHPSPGRVPAPEWDTPVRGGAAGAGAGGVRGVEGGAGAGGGGGGGGGMRAAGPPDNGSEERHTAEYIVLSPTGPVPIVGHGSRRWPPLVGAGVLVAAAATVVGLVVSNSSHPVTVRPNNTGTVTPVTHVPPSTAPPLTAPPSTPVTVPTKPTSEPVPAGFQAQSVTFVSAADGWVLGSVASTAGPCAALARTTDGGRTWSEVGSPKIGSGCPGAAADGSPYLNVRFANGLDGWIYASPGSGQLWSTHDGGTTWTPAPVPGSLVGATIGDLEASAGRVEMVVYGSCPAGSAGCQGQYEEQILSSPIGADSWAASPVQPAVGAGPALTPLLTLFGSSGWLVNDDRTTVSGARLTSTGAWSPWTPPCSTAGGPGLVGAASPTELVAVCAEGQYGTPDAGTVAGHDQLFRSADGGTTFAQGGEMPGSQPQSVTVAPDVAQTIVVADSQKGLLATFDGGGAWTPVVTGRVFRYVGFTTATQGVAIADQPGSLYMTRDGGHTWSLITF
jgi:photosystem II stability/assembly factor-like uncharacterized protein